MHLKLYENIFKILGRICKTLTRGGRVKNILFDLAEYDLYTKLHSDQVIKYRFCNSSEFVFLFTNFGLLHAVPSSARLENSNPRPTLHLPGLKYSNERVTLQPLGICNNSVWSWCD